MIRIIPAVKELSENEGYLSKKTVRFDSSNMDQRLAKAFAKLPYSEDGAEISVKLLGGEGESYGISITTDTIEIEAECERGVF